MSRLTRKELFKNLRPFIVSQQANEEGEWDAHCPLHDDDKRSAQFNFAKRLYFCHAGCGGGTLDELVEQIARLPDARRPSSNGNGSGPYRSKSASKKSMVTDASVAGWHSALLSNPGALSVLRKQRGLNMHTIKRYELGWDSATNSFTIPMRDKAGALQSIRHYKPGTTDAKKIWWEKNMGRPGIYPQAALDSDAVLLCEGEMDALLANQYGFPAVTGTAGAATWKDSWSPLFADKRVYIVYDHDAAGRKGARKAAQRLKQQAASIHIVKIPLRKRGADVTDWFVTEAHTADEFRELLRAATLYSERKQDILSAKPVDVNVLDSFNADLSGKPLQMMATITGRRNPPYLVPSKVKVECTMDAGARCQMCPLLSRNGVLTHTIDRHDPTLLRTLDTTDKQLTTVIREAIGIPRCDRFTLTVQQQQAVEVLFVRPSIENVDDDYEADYTNRKIFSAGKHNTLPNQTVRITGTALPSPEDKRNEFLAWDVNPIESSIDAFKITREIGDALRVFRPAKGERPLTRLRLIAEDLAAHVTRIVGRVDLHMALDLAYHSIINFKFSGKLVGKGWLELLIVGDTRTGKSEAAQRMISHYQAGKLISCESASFAGIVGGLQQFGQGREWAVTWGAIPLNDRRLVVLDEVNGLTPEQIATMSSIRSSGIAQLTKIYSEQTTARTRLVWLANPRHGRISDYTYGVHTIPALIGNPEDIARFDLAMSISADDVSPTEINRARTSRTPQLYSSELCHMLVLWAWSRRSDQVLWGPGAEQMVYAASVRLGQLYEENPPLIQAANVRMKIARLAVALAARTFSTDATYECVVVGKRHVYDAVQFIDWLYSRPGFGYRQASQHTSEERTYGARMMDDAKHYLLSNPKLARFLRNAGSTFRQDSLMNSANLTRDEASGVIAKLWDMRMLDSASGIDIRIQPLLQTVLREID